MISQTLKKIAGRTIMVLRSLFYGLLAAVIYLVLAVIKMGTGKKIVFCEFYSCRIGHIACELELFLRRYRQGTFYDKKNTLYIAYCSSFPIANRQLLKMYKRHLPVIESRLFAKVSNTWIKNTSFYTALNFFGNEYYEFNELRPSLSFINEEMRWGRELLSEMGIGENDWFVCFQARDPKYLGPGSEYHDYRDCDIDNYLKAAEYIVDQGGYAIRVGSVVDRPLPKNRHPHIIDYAVEYRSDFLDIFLFANCKFFLGCTSGPYNIASVFGVPVACANFIPISFIPCRKEDLFIPKKLFSRAKGRLLTFKEIQDSELMVGYHSYKYKNAGVEVVENSAEEILEMAKEMNTRLAGNYKSYADDEADYHKRFDEIFVLRHRGCPTKIGTHFLLQNKEMLAV